MKKLHLIFVLRKSIMAKSLDEVNIKKYQSELACIHIDIVVR
jgi:hypothetical protein